MRLTHRIVVALCLAATAPLTQATIITFNASSIAPGDPADDQTAYAAFLDAIADQGLQTSVEQFTGPGWDTVRSSITLGTHSATNVTSQGIDWHSSPGDYITTTSINSNNQPPWQIYSKDTALGGLHAVPATIIGDSIVKRYAVGVWVSGSSGGKLNMIFDQDTANPVSFKAVTGYENNDPNEPIRESIFLNSAKQFFGVIVTQGFNTFQLLEVEGVPEDQKLMWATDFTFANLPGDLDADGFVGITDLNLVLSNWNQTVPSADTRADANGDNYIGIEDLNAVLGNWNAGTPPMSYVPEPVSSGLLTVASLALLRRKMRL